MLAIDRSGGAPINADISTVGYKALEYAKRQVLFINSAITAQQSLRKPFDVTTFTTIVKLLEEVAAIALVMRITHYSQYPFKIPRLLELPTALIPDAIMHNLPAEYRRYKRWSIALQQYAVATTKVQKK